MHRVDHSYDDVRSEEVYRAVRSFMRHIATQLAETKLQEPRGMIIEID